MDKTIIIASNNKGKLKEINAILKDYGYTGVSMLEYLKKDIDIIEDGVTYEENAVLKAKTISKLTNKIVIADDSGLEVESMPNELGVYTARFRNDLTQYQRNELLIETCKERNNFKAKYVACIVLIKPDGNQYTFYGEMVGSISKHQKGESGFAYDPVFFLEEENRTVAELSLEEKNKYSHRGKALKKLSEELPYILK